MSNQEIREAVEKVKDIQSRIHFDCFRENMKREDDGKHLQTLLTLTQQVLEAKMPEEKEPAPFDGKNIAYCMGFNQALHDFRLYQQKCLNEKELRDIIKNNLNVSEGENGTPRLNNTIQAIRNLFDGGKR